MKHEPDELQEHAELGSRLLQHVADPAPAVLADGHCAGRGRTGGGLDGPSSALTDTPAGRATRAGLGRRRVLQSPQSSQFLHHLVEARK